MYNPNASLIFLLVGLIATLGDFVVPYLLGKRYPNYSNFKDTISTLGTNKSPVKKYLSYSLITTGSLLLIFSVGHIFIFSTYSWQYILYVLGIAVFGIGSILAGIFPEDIRGSGETTSGKIHGISSGLGFICLIFSPLWMFLILDNNGLRIFNILFFTLGLLSFIAFMVSYKRDGLTGLWQRVNMVTLYLPLMINYSILSL
jgi:hypothetical membrane protein